MRISDWSSDVCSHRPRDRTRNSDSGALLMTSPAEASEEQSLIEANHGVADGMMRRIRLLPRPPGLTRPPGRSPQVAEPGRGPKRTIEEDSPAPERGDGNGWQRTKERKRT